MLSEIPKAMAFQHQIHGDLGSNHPSLQGLRSWGAREVNPHPESSKTETQAQNLAPSVLTTGAIAPLCSDSCMSAVSVLLLKGLIAFGGMFGTVLCFMPSGLLGLTWKLEVVS